MLIQDFANIVIICIFFSEEPLEIKRIFAATRGVEEAIFDGTIDNNKLLVHASRPANFLGIVSR